MTAINVPTSIERDVVLNFVRSLGIDPNDAIELRIGVHRIEVDVYGRNEAGAHFCHPSGEPATHTIAIDMHHDEADQRDLGI